MAIRLQQIGLTEPKSTHIGFRNLTHPTRGYFRRASEEQSVRHAVSEAETVVMATDVAAAYLRTPTDPANELLTLPEACAELRVSKWTLYQFMRSRQLASIKLRRRRVIPGSAINELL